MEWGAVALEGFLLALAIGVLLADLLLPREGSRRGLFALAVPGLAVAGIVAWRLPEGAAFTDAWIRGLATVAEIRWISQKKVVFGEDLKPRLLTLEAPWQGAEPPPWKVIYHRYKARSGLDSRSGVLRVAAYLYLLKNYALKDWAAFNEVFGMPLRLGKYDPAASQADREALVTAIRSLGSDAAGVISKNTEIEFVEATARLSGSTNPYQVLAEFCNREMSKAVLGQTMTTDAHQAKGTYAAARVHAQVRRDLVEADALALAQTLREQLLRPLAGFNFGWDKPVGGFLLKSVEPRLIMKIMGMVLILFSAYKVIAPQFKVIFSRLWAIPTGVLSGILGAAIGADGPPVVVYAALKPWSKEQVVGMLQSFFLITNFVILGSYWVHGLLTPSVVRVAGIALRFAVGGILLAIRMNRRMSQRRFEIFLSLLIPGSWVSCSGCGERMD